MPKVPAGAQTMQSNGETFVVFKDGNAWLAVRPDWENMPASPTGRGGTPVAALTHLLQEERRLAKLPLSKTVNASPQARKKLSGGKW